MQTMRDNTKTLVNFRINDTSLLAFDDACVLSGKTRTQVLIELMRDFTNECAAIIPARIAEDQRSGSALRIAVERLYDDLRVPQPKPAGSTLRSRQRLKFTEFIADDPVVGKRR